MEIKLKSSLKRLINKQKPDLLSLRGRIRGWGRSWQYQELK